MKPIKLKLNLIILAIAAVTVGLAYVGFHTFLQIKHYSKNIRSTIEIKYALDGLEKKERTDEFIKELQALRADIQPEQRQTAFSDIIQAFTAKNNGLLKKRIASFEDNEKIFFKNFKKQIEYYEKKIIFHSTVLFCSIIALLAFLHIYSAMSVFIPLQSTTNRITDFLNGKYSYNFDTPDQDEMGELQATFNSMAQEVLRNMEELKALDSAKSDFLNIASHELRTPMTSIKGSLGLVSSGVMGDINEEVLKMIQIAEMETDRLVRLINDLLDMAKIDAKKLPLQLKWVPLHEIVDKTVMSLQGLAQTFDVQVVKNDFDNIDVNCDADRVQQVITNLVSNAVKFSPKNEKVEIIIEARIREPIKIMVRDHGKGMTPQEKSILFQKFRQVSSPDNPLVKGTGLGLAIAKALVEEHKGIIDVYTKPNEGSTFYFTLPEWRYQKQEQQRAAA